MPVSNIDDNLTEFGVIHSEELATEIKQSMDLIYKMIPVGEICPIMVQLGGPTPDPNIWQECDGSEITNVNSPLRSLPGQSRFTPNLTDRYVRISKVLGTVGDSGGISQFDFQHNHGGQTTAHESQEGADSTKSGLENTSFNHRHGVFNDPVIGGTKNIEPPNATVKFYMKIQ